MAELVYVKKLNAQELGYRRGEPGGAGRYIYISKNLLTYFPPLSTVVRNDHVIIMVIPPANNSIVLTNYVYHNDKITDHKENGRDEFRLYLNDANDPGRDYYKPEDIIVLRKIEKGGDVIYKIYHFPVGRRGDEYVFLNGILQKEGIRESHALIPIEKLPFISAQEPDILTVPKVIPKEITEEVLEESDLPLPSEIFTEEFNFTNFIRETAFRDLLLFFYDYRCAITGTIIKYENLNNLEAAHIIPDEHKGPAHPRNGIPMSRDMHWSFDKGFFTVQDDYTITVHNEILGGNPLLGAVNGRKLLLPPDKRAWPSSYSLKWHRENTFGIFLRSV